MSLTFLSIMIFVVVLGLAASATYFFVAEPATKKRMQGRLAAMLAVGMQLPGGRELKLRRKKASEVPLFDRALAQFKWVQGIQLFIQQAGLQITATMLLLMSFSLALLVCLAGLVMNMPALLLLVTAAGVGAIPFLVINFMRNRRFAKFEELFPDTIDMMARAVRAGHAMTTALELIATEMPEPIATEFRITHEQQSFGLPLHEALQNLLTRVPVSDLNVFVTALSIQRISGGNLAELLDNLSGVIRERFKIMRQVQVFTAQGRLTLYLLSCLPPGTALMLYFMSPDYILPLFKDPLGHQIIGVAVTMQILGIVVIRKIIRIKV